MPPACAAVSASWTPYDVLGSLFSKRSVIQRKSVSTVPLADIERGFRVLRVGDRNRPGVPPLAGSYSRPCSHLLYGADPGSGDARTPGRPFFAACRQSGGFPFWAGSRTTGP